MNFETGSAWVGLILGVITIIWAINLAFKCHGRLRHALYFASAIGFALTLEMLVSIWNIAISQAYNHVFEIAGLLFLLIGLCMMHKLLKEIKKKNN